MGSDSSEPHISGALPSDADTSTDALSTPTFAAFDTLNVRKKDQKGPAR
jgi:hypothetical protein